MIELDHQGFGPSGLAQDVKQGFTAVPQHHSAFIRVAVVTDKQWAAG